KTTTSAVTNTATGAPPPAATPSLRLVEHAIGPPPSGTTSEQGDLLLRQAPQSEGSTDRTFGEVPNSGRTTAAFRAILDLASDRAVCVHSARLPSRNDPQRDDCRGECRLLRHARGSDRCFIHTCHSRHPFRSSLRSRKYDARTGRSQVAHTDVRTHAMSSL